MFSFDTCLTHCMYLQSTTAVQVWIPPLQTEAVCCRGSGRLLLSRDHFCTQHPLSHTGACLAALHPRTATTARAIPGLVIAQWPLVVGPCSCTCCFWHTERMFLPELVLREVGGAVLAQHTASAAAVVHRPLQQQWQGTARCRRTATLPPCAAWCCCCCMAGLELFIHLQTGITGSSCCWPDRHAL